MFKHNKQRHNLTNHFDGPSALYYSPVEKKFIKKQSLRKLRRQEKKALIQAVEQYQDDPSLTSMCDLMGDYWDYYEDSQYQEYMDDEPEYLNDCDYSYYDYGYYDYGMEDYYHNSPMDRYDERDFIIIKPEHVGKSLKDVLEEYQAARSFSSIY